MQCLLQLLPANYIELRRASVSVLGMTLNCIHTKWCPGYDVKLHHIFIVTGSFLYWCVMRPASQRFFIHSFIYLRLFIISFLCTNSLSVLMCHKAVNQLSVGFVFVCLYNNNNYNNNNKYKNECEWDFKGM